MDEEGNAKYRDYADYIVNHERRPGIGPLMGWRGNGDQTGRGAPNPDQLQRYIDNGGFAIAHIPDEAQFFKPWNAAYQDWAVSIGIYDKPQPYLFSIWSEPMQRFRLAAEGHGERQPPEHLARTGAGDDGPLPICMNPSARRGRRLSRSRPDPAADGDVSFLGSQNAWLRQIHGVNPLYVPTKVWKEHGFQTATGPA